MASEEFIRIDGATRVQVIIEGMEAAIATRPMMLEIGEFIRFRIQARTAEGKDVKGNLFAPYSPQYRLFREKTGHPVNKVNLFYTGSMMGSMAVAETSNQARVYFLNTQGPGSKARNPEKAYYLNQKREFFALSAEDIRGIIDIMEDYYQKALNRLTKR